MPDIPSRFSREKILHVQDVIKYVNGTQTSEYSSSWVLDTAHLHHLTVHLYWAQSVTFSYGDFCVIGTNLSDNVGPVPIDPVSHYGNSSLSGGVITLPTGGAGKDVLVYKDLPRWVKFEPTLTGAGSMVGEFHVSVFGWYV